MYKSDINHDNKTLEEKLQALFALRADKNPTRGFRPEYLNLLAKLGNPHLFLPPTIHVAGTNGKGSTIAYLRAILEAAGKRVHVYTSPHLVRFNERIVLAGTMIADDYLETLIDRALTANNGASVSFFEVTTAIAFKAFADAPADFLLLETGLGGRLDCTNVIENPIATVITTIGLDHQEYLGNTLEDIAFEKAGIMKAGAPCINGAGNHGAITQRAAALGVDLYTTSSPSRAQSSDLMCRDNQTLPRALCGQGDVFKEKNALNFQDHNRAVALKTIDILNQSKILNISDKQLKNGINNFSWPARMQHLNIDMPDGWDVYLDGGHNADAARAIAEQILGWNEETPEKDVYLIIGMMAHKDHAAFITPLNSVSDNLTFIDIPHEPHAQSGQALQDMYTSSKYFHDYKEALKHIVNHHEGGRILICGSLYLAGHILKSEGLM